jgi:hypothetical protein
MSSHVLRAATCCETILLIFAVSLSTSSRAAEVPQFGLAKCFQAQNVTGLTPSYTTLLAVSTDPAFEQMLCQVDTEIPISGLFAHFVLPNRDWLVVTRAGLYRFDPSGVAVALDIDEAVGTTGAALGPSGSVAITTDDHIAIVDTEKGTVERLLETAGNDSPYFLPDGTILVGRDDKVVQVSAETGRDLRTITVGDHVIEITRRADGIIMVKTLAEVILYDEDFQEYARFAGVQATHPCLRPRRSGSRC